jgi:hypothetical protein
VVDESYSLVRGGTRPLVYYAKDGYIARLSALDYDQKTIQAPSWGRSEEAQFLPLQLVPNLNWTNVIFPVRTSLGGLQHQPEPSHLRRDQADRHPRRPLQQLHPYRDPGQL